MPILGTITPRISLQTIIEMVESDFGVTIGKTTAMMIRAALTHNCLVWDATKLVTTDGSQIKIYRLEDGSVKAHF